MRGARKVLRLLVGVGVAGLFGWLVLRQVSVEQMKNAFANVGWGWLGLALFCFLLGYSARIERWRRMLARDNADLRWRDCAGPFMGSFAMNNVLPMRAGDILRAFAFNDRLGVTSGVVVATLFVERLLDLLMVVLLLGIALWVSGASDSLAGGVGIWTLAAAGLVIALALLFPGAFSPLLAWGGRLLSRISPRIGARVQGELLKGVDTLGHLSGKGTMAGLMLWSVLAWTGEGLVFYLCAKALASLAVAAAAWLALPLGTLATLLPGTPGYVGTFDYFVVRAMKAMGNGVAESTVYALLVHFMLWLPPTVIGGLFLMTRSMRGKPSSEDRK
ncbi:flippase-like domain-containing protein [Stenotrophomonas maltophilia]|nr:flippase-like domain-containing protein [Stenotrophomonas maltophilia]